MEFRFPTLSRSLLLIFRRRCRCRRRRRRLHRHYEKQLERNTDNAELIKSYPEVNIFSVVSRYITARVK